MSVLHLVALQLSNPASYPTGTVPAPALELGILAAVLVMAIATSLTLSASRGAQRTGTGSEYLMVSFRRLSVLIIAISSVTLVVAGYSMFRGNRTAQYYQTMRLVTGAIRSGVGESHVWLEEWLEGDTSVRLQADVVGPMELMEEICLALRVGGPTPFGTLPPAPAALRADAEQLCTGITRLTALTRQRLEQPAVAGAGSAADQAYDEAYYDVVRSLESMQADLRGFGGRIARSSYQTEMGLLALIFVLAAAAVVLSASARRAMRADLVALRRLAAVVDSSSDAIYSIGIEGTILSWNGGAEAIYGYTAEQVMGRHASLLIPPEAQAQIEEHLELLHSGGRVSSVEVARVDRGGRTRYLSISASPTLDAAGQLTSIAVVARDVTPQKLAEQQLRASHERYRLVGRATNDLLWERDAAGTLLWTERARETLGYEDEELQPEVDWWVERIHPEDCAEVLQHLAATADEGGELWSVEYRFRRADGSYATVLDRGYFERDQDGAPRRAVGALTDVTAQRRAAEELRRAKEEAERADRAKSEFLSRMSHELRTPLNSVLGFAQVLRFKRTAALGETDLVYVDRILSNGRHLLSLIDEVLDLSRIEAGKMTAQLEPVALPALIDEVLGQLQGSVGAKPICLVAEVSPEAAPILTDRARLAQILHNIVGNAIKFTDRGTVRVSLITDPATARPQTIQVSDTGIGIPADRIASIFQPFEQADTGWARRYGGTGLGLSISRSLAELLGYTIRVRSRPGHGSTFTIDLEGSDAAGAHSEASEAVA